MSGTDPLPAWNEGTAKNTILDFVARVTTAGSPTFVEPADRVATFDNDGTLWCEKPVVIQLDYILERWVDMAQKDASLRDQQPWKAAVEKDHAWFDKIVTKHYEGDDSEIPVLLKGLLAAYAGLTVEQVAEGAATFFQTRSHSTLKRPYHACGYVPMIELLRYLEANGFTNYIASGGGRDFMRQITQEIYGIPPERVIGSSTTLEFQEDGDGGRLLLQPKLDVLDDGSEKPHRIWNRIGKRPIFAAGNSNGDIAMLKFANMPPRPAYRLLVLHDDAAREFDYVKGAEKSLEVAKQYGWTVASIKNDWKSVFAP